MKNTLGGRSLLSQARRGGQRGSGPRPLASETSRKVRLRDGSQSVFRPVRRAPIDAIQRIGAGGLSADSR